MAQLNFNAAQFSPEVPREAIPAGWYAVQMVESEMKPTSAGNGAYLQVTLQVLEGAFAGRKVIDRMNLNNPNATAVQLAQARLSSYCHATGVIQCMDSAQLHGIPMKVKLSVRTDPTGQYEPSNEVRQVKHINEPTESGPAVGMAPAQAPATPAWAGQQTPAQHVAPAPAWAGQQAAAPAPAPVQTALPLTGADATPPWAAPAPAQAPTPAPQAPAQDTPPWAQ